MIRVLVAIGYALVPAMGVALVIASKARREKLAGLGELLDRVLANRAARITLLLFVWWLGWHFLVPN